MSRVSFDPSFSDSPPRFLDRSTARITVMGDSRTGKTSLVLRWLSGSYKSVEQGAYFEDIYHRNMLFHQFMRKHLNPGKGSAEVSGLDDLQKYAVVDVQVLDCESGDATYDNMEVRTAQIKQSDAFILCFDPRDSESFEDLSAYAHRIRDTVGDAVIVVCATKCDLGFESEFKSEVIDEQLSAMGLSADDDYVEVSAKTGANVDKLFCKVLSKISEHKKMARSSYMSVHSGGQEGAGESNSLVSATSSSASLASQRTFHTARRPSRIVTPTKEFKEEAETKRSSQPCCVIC